MDPVLTIYRNTLLAAGHSPSTVSLYLNHITLLERERPGDSLLTVEQTDLEGFLARRRMSHAAETRKSFRAAFRSFYSWAHRAGFIEHDPAAGLRPVKIPRIIPRLAPDDDVQASLITATVEQRVMILLARLACLRLTELTTLRINHREGDLLRITGKGQKQRIVPINDDLMHVILQRELDVDDYYFPGRAGPHLHPQSVNKIITRVTGWNPHSLRHAGATAAFRATRDLRAVQELLGHASLATTERYLHVGLQEVRLAASGTAMTTGADARRTTGYSPEVPRAVAA